MPGHAGQLLDEHTGDRIDHVLVVPGRAERRGGRHVPQPAHHLVDRVVEAAPVDVGPRQTRAMREQVTHGDLACHPWIVQRELRQVIDDAIVPAQLALVHQHGERRGGHRLGRGADGKARVLVDRVRLADLAKAVSLCEHQRVVLHEGDRQPGQVPVAHGTRDVRIERSQIRRAYRRGTLLPARTAVRQREARRQEQNERTARSRHHILHPSRFHILSDHMKTMLQATMAL